jgi:hypothetical protein
MTLLEHGRVQGGRTDLWLDGFFLLFFMPASKTITEDRIERKKKARCKKQHTSSCRDQILRNIIAADLQSDGISNRGITCRNNQVTYMKHIKKVRNCNGFHES